MQKLKAPQMSWAEMFISERPTDEFGSKTRRFAMGRTMINVFDSSMKMTEGKGYIRLDICTGYEGVFFGSNLQTSIEAGSVLHCGVGLNISSAKKASGIIFLALKRYREPEIRVAFVKARKIEPGQIYLSLKDSDTEFLPPVHKQYQVSNCGKFFRFLMEGIWYTTDPKEKRKYPYIKASDGNLICEYLFEEDAAKEAELAEKLRQVALKYEAEESEVEELKRILALEQEEKNRLAQEKDKLTLSITLIKALILKEKGSRSKSTFSQTWSQIWRVQDSPARSLINEIDKEISNHKLHSHLLPRNYNCGGGEGEL